jgi:hypothetical protein
MSYHSLLDTVLRSVRRSTSWLLLSSGALAAPGGVQAFGVDTWAKLQRSAVKAQAVVFTTTECVHCPVVIEQLATALGRSPRRVGLAVVVMDGQDQPAALLADRHYRLADTLYAFDGDTLALRHRVNPEWRGLTPYVVLLPAKGPARYFNGAPSADALRSFLQP